MRSPAAPILIVLALLVPALALAQNQPPVADAGEDQTVFLGDVAELQGTATDADGDPITAWLWSIVSSPPGSFPVLFDEFSADAVLSADMAGDYVVTLRAQDFFLWSDPDAVLITVVENLPPTAVASASPLSGLAPLTVQFDGMSSSDPEEGPLFYDWDFGDLTSGTGVTTTHTYQLPGVYMARIMVTDDHSKIDFDTVEITVTEPVAVPSLSPPSIAALVLLLLGSVAFTLRRARGEARRL